MPVSFPYHMRVIRIRNKVLAVTHQHGIREYNLGNRTKKPVVYVNKETAYHRF